MFQERRTRFAAAWAVAALLCGAGAVAQAQEPAGRWALEDGSGAVATDAGAHGYDGQLNGGAAWSTDTAPTAAANCSSLNMGGGADPRYVLVQPSGSELDMSPAGFTLSAWIKPSSGAGAGMAVAKGLGGSDNEYALFLDSQGHVSFLAHASDGAQVGTGASLSDLRGDWRHVAAVYDGLRFILYVDGEVEQIRPYSGSLKVDQGDLALGRQNTALGGDMYWDGLLDEVRVYQDALTPSQIEALAARDDGSLPDQDSDGEVDACDADDDNDGLLDGADNCPLDANANQRDLDGDGVGDACDEDGTQILFTMGQIEVFAREPNTQVRIVNLDNGAPYVNFSLTNAGDRFSRTSGVPRYVQVSSDKPVTLFTGKALAGRNDWASLINSDNNTEFGTSFHGFTEYYLWVFVPKDGDPTPTSVQITDLSDGDDSVTLSPGNAVINNGSMEVYERTGFENDAVRVQCSRPCVVQVGSSSIKSSTGWSFTPPSIAPGEDGRELGTRFAFYANSDLTIWPFSDDTQVQIIDLSDGDDSRTVTLDANQFFSLRTLPGLTGERSLVHAGGNLFDNDFVEVRSNKPVLTFSGPNYDPGGGFTLDFAPTVPTGSDTHESFVYANGIGMELLTYDRNTTVQLKTVSGNANHTLTVGPSDWRGVGPYYWEAPFQWNRELVHLTANRPTITFFGDFFASYFGGCCSASFVPVIPPTRTQDPIARAGVDIEACSFDTINFSAASSFDQDDFGQRPNVRAWKWDFDTQTNSDGLGGADDDTNSTQEVGSWTYPADGTYTVRLTVTDNEGEFDDDYVTVIIDTTDAGRCGTDSDNDGVGANNDNCLMVFNPDQVDTDGDGDGDLCDADRDDDGLLNDQDNCPVHANEDQADADGDGEGDACDADRDGDGVNNGVDNCPAVVNPGQADADGDGAGDLCDGDDDDDELADGDDNCPVNANPTQADLDSDGQGDACDTDDDNDGVADGDDNCPRTANADQADGDGDGLGDACDQDQDVDGVGDVEDNCPNDANPDQTDSDGDGAGDACDADDDGDGVADGDDNCPRAMNAEQTDTDFDTDGDACDVDDDDDGVLDLQDNCPVVINASQGDVDGDGQGDVCDNDDDNDGLLDMADNCPRVANLNQRDSDGDGAGDACDNDDDNDGVNDVGDNCPVDANPGQEDADFDGRGDACDFDSDATAPQIIPSLTNAPGFDEMDTSTWKPLGNFGTLDIRAIFRDVGSGLAEAQVTLVREQDMTFRVLSQIAYDGETLVPNPALCAHETLCDGSLLQLDLLEAGAWSVVITLRDRAFNLVHFTFGFRLLDLRAALVELRREMNALESGDAQIVALRDEIVQRLGSSIVSYDEGYYGNIWVGLEDSLSLERQIEARGVDSGWDPTVAVTVDLSILFQEALNEATLEEVGQEADADITAQMQGRLAQARLQRDANARQDAILEVGNSFFWRNLQADAQAVPGFVPGLTGSYSSAFEVGQNILTEVDTYLAASEDLPGRMELSAARVELQSIVTYLDDVVQEGDLEQSDLEHAEALLGLTDLALELKDAEGSSTWVRNWQWGLVQVTALYAGRALFNAGTWIGTGGPIYQKGQERFEAAEAHRVNHRVDDYMNTLIESRCLVTGTYNGIYNPDLVVPTACCSLIREYNALDNRFPVPEHCAPAHTVLITDAGLEPANLTVGAGELILWVNRTGGEVSLTGGTPGSPAPGSLDSGALGPDEVFESTFGAGNLPYFLSTEDGDTLGQLTVQ